MDSEIRRGEQPSRLPNIVNGYPCEPPLLYTIEEVDRSALLGCIQEQFPFVIPNLDTICFINNPASLDRPYVPRKLKQYPVVCLGELRKPDRKTGYVIQIRADAIAAMHTTDEEALMPSNTAVSIKDMLVIALQLQLFRLEHMRSETEKRRFRSKERELIELFIDAKSAEHEQYPPEGWFDAFRLKM